MLVCEVPVTNSHPEDSLRIRDVDETLSTWAQHSKNLIEDRKCFVSGKVLKNVPKENNTDRSTCCLLQMIQKIALNYAVNPEFAGQNDLLSRNVNTADGGVPIPAQNIYESSVSAA